MQDKPFMNMNVNNEGGKEYMYVLTSYIMGMFDYLQVVASASYKWETILKL